MPPRHGRRRGPVVLLLIGALIVLVIGGAYYNSDYKPRHYLENWFWQVGVPAGTFSGEIMSEGNHSLTGAFSEQCPPSASCDPAPVKAVKDWVDDDGGHLDDDTVAGCFRDGGSFTYHHEEHAVMVHCDRVDTTLYEYRFTASITY